MLNFYIKLISFMQPANARDILELNLGKSIMQVMYMVEDLLVQSKLLNIFCVTHVIMVLFLTQWSSQWSSLTLEEDINLKRWYERLQKPLCASQIKGVLQYFSIHSLSTSYLVYYHREEFIWTEPTTMITLIMQIVRCSQRHWIQGALKFRTVLNSIIN